MKIETLYKRGLLTDEERYRLVVQQWEKTTDHFPALLGGGMALVCLTVLGPDRFMLPALLITSAILFVTRTGEVRAK